MGFQPDVANDELTEQIIGVAIQVHRLLGPKQPEEHYKKLLIRRLEKGGFDVIAEYEFTVMVDDIELGVGYADLVVDGEVVLELKVVNKTTDSHFQQLGREVMQTEATRGLLLNFGTPRLGIRRWVDDY
jgi:GxxExxY protein